LNSIVKFNKLGASAIMVDGDQCIIAGTQSHTDSTKFTTVVSFLGKECVDNNLLGSGSSPIEVISMSDTRSSLGPTWYGWQIERIIYDRDQNNAKGIGVPCDLNGNILRDKSWTIFVMNF